MPVRYTSVDFKQERLCESEVPGSSLCWRFGDFWPIRNYLKQQDWMKSQGVSERKVTGPNPEA